MKTESIPESADHDTEARAALWKAICVASDDVRGRFSVRSVVGAGGVALSIGSGLPDVATWQLVEALCLLGVILRSEDATVDVLRLFGKAGPVEIREDGIVSQLWAQRTLHGEKSALSGRPDLIVTSSPDPPSPSNATRIIEAKCVKQLGTQAIRSEFGKAHDLRVATYLIWSFYSPNPKVIAGARGLGIDLEPLGFDTEWREALVRSPDALIARVAYFQEHARRTQRFARALADAGEGARRKLLPPSR